MRLNFTENNRTKPVPYWASKMGRALDALFTPRTDNPQHPVPHIVDSNALTPTLAEATTASLPNLWKTHQTRKAVYADIERMDNEDETVATALDIIADCSVSYNETDEAPPIFVSDDPEVQKILNRLSTRLDLRNELWQIARDGVKQGNEFREIIIDRKLMHVTGLKQTVSYQIYPRTDEMGNKVPGWLVRTDADIYSDSKGLLLSEWQICSFQFGSKRGFLATPPLATARRNWIRLTKMEDGMAIARLVRAYDKVVHKIPVKAEMPEADIMRRIKMYKENITKKRMMDSEGLLTQLDSPLDVQSDYFLPTTGADGAGVELLSANNAQLGNLNDVIYHREKLLTRLQVPIGYLQITSAQKTHIAAGAAKKGDVELQFARMLRRVQRMVTKGLRRVADIELLLHGVLPTEELYKVQLTKINTKDLREDADIELTYAQAAVYFIEAFGALPPELLMDKFMHLDTEQREMLNKFITKYGEKITKAQVKAIEEAAKPKPGGSDLTKDRLPGDNKGAGSGNQNKAKGRRTSEQIGKAATKKSDQSVSLETMVDLVYNMQEALAQDFRDQGIDLPDLDEATQRNVISLGLHSFIQNTEGTLRE